MNNITKPNISWYKYLIFIPIQLISIFISIKTLKISYEDIFFSFIIMSILLCIYLLHYFKYFIVNLFLSVALPSFIYVTLELLRFYCLFL